MSDATPQAGPAVRASDAEREQTVALLQHNFADGRLTQAELEERAGAAYAAQSRAQLRDLTADLPAAQQQPPRSCLVLDQRLLIILLCVHPPAALIYWLLCRCRRPATAGTELPGLSDQSARADNRRVPYLTSTSTPFFDRSASVHAARSKQQGRRLPERSFEIPTSTRRSRV
jgi:hypothetical protein